MNWQEVCEHSSLKNLPFKIELNEQGQILMSPVKVYHSAFQGKIARLLPSIGEVLAECAIKTKKGTKVADVAWVSSERFEKIKYETDCSIAPEICIEILSSSNTKEELEEKRLLYFDAGALEVWYCHENGQLHFFDRGGRLNNSLLAPSFPQNITL